MLELTDKDIDEALKEEKEKRDKADANIAELETEKTRRTENGGRKDSQPG